jgi:hypothetical protein
MLGAGGIMGPILTLIVGVIYTAIALDYGLRLNNWPMGGVFLGYAFSNAFLYKLG